MNASSCVLCGRWEGIAGLYHVASGHESPPNPPPTLQYHKDSQVVMTWAFTLGKGKHIYLQ